MRLRRTAARSIPVLCVAVLVAVGCGDDQDARGQERSGVISIPARVLVLAPGSDIDPGGAPVTAWAVVEGGAEFADRYLGGDRATVTTTFDGVDLGETVLLGGVVSTGCDTPTDVEVRVDDDTLELLPVGLPDEPTRSCASTVTTVALVAVDPANVPEAMLGGVEAAPGPPAGGQEVPSELVLLEPGRDRAPSVDGPGAIRDRTDLAAFADRFGIDRPDEEVAASLDGGDVVLIGGEIAGGCAFPVGAQVESQLADMVIVGVYAAEAPDTEECDSPALAAALLAVDIDDIAPGAEVGGSPLDAPAGPGEVVALAPVDADAVAAAAEVDGPGALDAFLATVPGAPDLDLPAPRGRTVRRAFVVLACEPVTAEVLVVDDGVGDGLGVAPQQGADEVDCETSTPHLIVVEVGDDLADLTPVAR